MRLDFHSFIQKLRRLFPGKRGYVVLGTILAIIFLLLLFRGCGSSAAHHRGTYTLARGDRFDNINLMGKDRNLTAFLDELISSIAVAEKMKFLLSVIPSNNLIRHLESQQVDGVFTFMAPTPLLEHSLVFSEPIFLIGPVLVVPENSPYDTWEELKYKIIGINSQSVTLLELEKDSTLQLRLYDNMLSALADLDAHRIDGVILPALQAYIYTGTFYPGRLKVATSSLTNEGLRLVALKNRRGEKLVELFDQGLNRFKESGEYDQLIDRWALVNPEKAEEQIKETPETQRTTETTGTLEGTA